jgi:hypothetical protein
MLGPPYLINPNAVGKIDGGDEGGSACSNCLIRSRETADAAAAGPVGRPDSPVAATGTLGERSNRCPFHHLPTTPPHQHCVRMCEVVKAVVIDVWCVELCGAGAFPTFDPGLGAGPGPGEQQLGDIGG